MKNAPGICTTVLAGYCVDWTGWPFCLFPPRSYFVVPERAPPATCIASSFVSSRTLLEEMKLPDFPVLVVSVILVLTLFFFFHFPSLSLPCHGLIVGSTASCAVSLSSCGGSLFLFLFFWTAFLLLLLFAYCKSFPGLDCYCVLLLLHYFDDRLTVFRTLRTYRYYFCCYCFSCVRVGVCFLPVFSSIFSIFFYLTTYPPPSTPPSSPPISHQPLLNPT